MGQVLHGSARTTAAVRRAIQHSQTSLRTLAKRHGINPKTVAKWRARANTADQKPGPKAPHSTVLSIEEEAIIVAFRRQWAWTGKDKSLAAYSSGGWCFVPPIEGMSVFVRSTSNWALYRAGAWELGALRGSSVLIDDIKVIGRRLPAIAAPAAGSTVDAEARSAIGQILSAMRQHGLIEM